MSHEQENGQTAIYLVSIRNLVLYHVIKRKLLNDHFYLFCVKQNVDFIEGFRVRVQRELRIAQLCH